MRKGSMSAILTLGLIASVICFIAILFAIFGNRLGIGEDDAVADARATGEPEITESAEVSPTPSPAVEYALDTGKDGADLYDELYDGYYIGKLSRKEKALFNRIYDAIFAHEPGLELSEPVERDEVALVMRVIDRDCPELFDYDHYSRYSYSSAPDMITRLAFYYYLDEPDYIECTGELYDSLLELRDKCRGLSDNEKQLVVLEHIERVCAYRDGSWQDGCAYGALMGGYARCEGYAKAFCLAMRFVGVEAIYVSGETFGVDADSTGLHAWNVIKLDGKYYSTDPTWCDTDKENPFPYYAYLNLDDEAMFSTRSYSEKNPFAPPACDSSKYEPYIMSGNYVYAGASAKDAWHEAMSDAINSRESGFAYRVENTELFDDTYAGYREWTNDICVEFDYALAGYSTIFDDDARVICVTDMEYR